MERWDGHRGFGPLNAQRAMERACALAKENGVGIVALGNNNHWMRGGTYGWLAAEKGCIGICWSNTAPNMPAWGAKDCRIGNNPLILAVPRSDGQHVMVDCALSQFSYGKLESTRLAGRQLPVPGGCDEDGQLTTDPAAIEKSGRALPIGYWKGSGLSILLDLIATLLSGGNAVHTIGTFGDEIGLTQIMIAIDPTKFGTVEENDAVISAILADIKASTPARPDGEVRWPGEGMLRTIKENRELGVPVVEEIWESVLKM
jgi:3-dehydro-L-gulonate 2-dehydrogenase